jgi:hypothetical protein
MLASFYSPAHTQLILPIFSQTAFAMTTYVITALPETAPAKITNTLTTYAQMALVDDTSKVQDVAIP